ncbi:4-hydroxy-tetrahydrodipicolinate synthase [Croceifilum oryzae]|uniref:4-hydroxy-tetrahydrodipicolinate synthase n=1 Tax=Croceifilum oryzae TaxID=1553429 RepID=A0AAJ1TDI2_9BACL|nr:4-hydroxy-tetrahydrodipicolinate synthase [Croceifilum oryzae]MDQ0416900.1 4-hydroxy-tetrahydrodipicolinate synthase [Croceifilum oryzae]
MNFGRMITAMCTPFDSNLQIDWNKQEALIEHLIATGTDTIVVSGTTAESPTLTKEEKCKLFSFTLEKVNKRVKVIAGTGSNSTADTIALTKQAEEIGVDGVMLVAPYYNRPSQEGLYQHFAAIHNETKLPLMIYNVPGRTSVNISTETLVRLAALPNVVAIKEASGSISQISDVIRLVPKDVAVYSGDDALTLPVLALGGAGVVSVASHVVGVEMNQMIDAFFEGNHQEAQAIHHTLTPVFHGLFFTTSPGPLKYALSRMELMEEHVRLPLVTLTPEEKGTADVWIKAFYS